MVSVDSVRSCQTAKASAPFSHAPGGRAPPGPPPGLPAVLPETLLHATETWPQTRLGSVKLCLLPLDPTAPRGGDGSRVGAGPSRQLWGAGEAARWHLADPSLGPRLRGPLAPLPSAPHGRGAAAGPAPGPSARPLCQDSSPGPACGSGSLGPRGRLPLPCLRAKGQRGPPGKTSAAAGGNGGAGQPGG